MANETKDMSRQALEAEVLTLRSSIDFIMARVAEVVADNKEKDAYMITLNERKQSSTKYYTTMVEVLEGEIKNKADLIDQLKELKQSSSTCVQHDEIVRLEAHVASQEKWLVKYETFIANLDYFIELQKPPLRLR
jgi:hypothetical protein